MLHSTASDKKYKQFIIGFENCPLNALINPGWKSLSDTSVLTELPRHCYQQGYKPASKRGGHFGQKF